ncbi:hypothetical protein DESUT3_32150 [Desulfuromonas versatilis]|uniref:Peptidase n=1 Tax=Desulfuromonas versatilis TaxID=2802975 RepID=A0ABN6E542_9BACT|nr:hypothetical protein [Desulfuromonas versatilis]BCR06146.1 hypothetical protein DESUT3_32150 [Desulfuromonas versatilis]
MPLTWLILLVLAGIVNFVFSFLILKEVAGENAKVNYFEIRWQVHKHLKTYKSATRAKTGRVGSAYYGYLGSLGLLIAFALLLLNSLGR